MNETTTAFFRNYEAIDVFCSWTQDYQRVLHKEQRFDSLWNNVDPAVETIDFPKVAREKLLSYRRSDLEMDVDQQQYPLPDHTLSPKPSEIVGPRVPPDFQLRDYQLEAIKEWGSRSFQGIFDMATVLALMLFVITATNIPVTRSARYSRSRGGLGTHKKSARWAGIRVWRTAKTYCLHQSANDKGRTRVCNIPFPIRTLR